MRLIVRSAVRAWTKRPAGPILVALGVLVAGLLAGSTDLALDGASQAQRDEDAAELGQLMGRVWTPGGFTIDEPTLENLQTRVHGAAGGSRSPAASFPVFLERDASVSAGGTTSSDWTVLGLPTASIEAMGLTSPGPGQALVDAPEDRSVPDSVVVRARKAPADDVRLERGLQGQLAMTTQDPTGGYTHDENDDYVFEPEIRDGAKQIAFFLTTADNDTDFDLEVATPDGETYLDDDGTPAQPEMPRIEVEDPPGGDWTVEVHAKFARQTAFRLEIVEVFDARDARVVGRLLAGEGFRAVGAELGLTEQARFEVDAQDSDLSALGPGGDGIVVLPLERLQGHLDLPDRASGLFVTAAPGEDPLDGLPDEREASIEAALADARDAADGRLDPVRGVELVATADQLREQRDARLESTEELLFVVLPAGVFAGILLATWAAGLHTRRLRDEVRVLAGLGQSRARSWTLVALHLGPPFLIGTLLALALSPALGLVVAQGIGLDATTVLVPGIEALLVPLAAAVPVAGTARLTLRDAVEGQDPRAAGLPTPKRQRWIVAGLWTILVLALGATLWGAGLDPTDGYLVGAGIGAAAGLAVLWAPLLAPLLDRARTLSVSSLGLFRTRSTHAYLALAAATATLVLAAMLAGTALSQAASPDVETESGGYAVVAETPRFTSSLASIAPEGGEDARLAQRLLDESLGIEFVMRVTGTGIHSADTGRVQTVYGIDSSFAQRNQHRLTTSTQTPVRDVAGSTDKALVTPSVRAAMDGSTIEIQGPQGQLSYEVVGVVETRLLEGVYISKEAMPTHFDQIAGEQRIRLGDETDADAYAGDLQRAFRESGLTAQTSQAMVEDRLSGQQRAGTTLQVLASLGVATALLLVVLIGLRAQAERRTTDAVLVALGARPREIAVGIATETLVPLIVGFGLGAIFVLPLAAGLDALSGLAFPLTPIDTGSLVVATLATLGAILALGLLVSVVVAYRAVRGLDQKALRELG